MQGRVDVMKMMMEHDENDTIATSLTKEDGKKPPSLLHLAIANDFIDCAEWLVFLLLWQSCIVYSALLPYIPTSTQAISVLRLPIKEKD